MKFKLNNVFPNKDCSFQIALILTVLVFFVTATPTLASAASVSFDHELYGYFGDPIIITVEDDAGKVSVPVRVFSDSDPDGTTLQLTERDDLPGVYQNVGGLIMMNGNNEFPLDSTVLIRVTDEHHFFPNDLDNPDMIFVDVVSSFPSVVEGLVLTETGSSTRIYEGTLTFSSTGLSDGNVIQVKAGDSFTVFAPCRIGNGLITPNPNATVGAVFAAVDDQITVTYDSDPPSTPDTATILTDDQCGGSGGGLVINRVVLDVLAGTGTTGDFTPPLLALSKLKLSSLPLIGDMLETILNADPFTPIMPLDDPSIDYPISINGNGYLLTQYANTIQTYTGKTGEPISFKMTLFDATGVEHIGLYTNLRGDHREIQDSDTYITYNEGKPLEITDPHGFFSNVNFTESEYNGKYIADFNMTFAKPMDTSDVMIRTWDEKRNSGDIKIFDAIKIEGEPIVNPDTNNLILPESSEILIPYYKLPYYEIPNADSDGNLIYYNSFGGLEEKKVQSYHAPTVYPNYMGRAERHDDEYRESIINEETRAQTLAQSLIVNPFNLSEDNQKDVKFFYPSNVGKLDRENKDLLKDMLSHENMKAYKIFSKKYHTNLVHD